LASDEASSSILYCVHGSIVYDDFSIAHVDIVFYLGFILSSHYMTLISADIGVSQRLVV